MFLLFRAKLINIKRLYINLTHYTLDFYLPVQRTGMFPSNNKINKTSPRPTYFGQ
jgi:hypothetical protein